MNKTNLVNASIQRTKSMVWFVFLAVMTLVANTLAGSIFGTPELVAIPVIVKVVTLVGLLLWAIYQAYLVDSKLQILFDSGWKYLIPLAASIIIAAIADIFTALNRVYSTPENPVTFYLIFGMVFFALCHIGLIVTYSVIKGKYMNWLAAIVTGVVTVGGVIVGFILLYIWPQITGPVFKWAVLGYAIVISAMVVMASTNIGNPRLGSVADVSLILGSVMFMISDMCITMDLFAKNLAYRPLVLPTYYIALMLIMASVLILRERSLEKED